MLNLNTAKEELERKIDDVKRQKLQQALELFIDKAKEEITTQVRDYVAGAAHHILQNQLGEEDIKLPAVTVTMPPIEIKLPDIQVAPTTVEMSPVTLNVPKAEKPNVSVSMPVKGLINEMRAIKKAVSEQKPIDAPMIEIPEYTMKKPMPVIMTDLKGDPWTPLVGGGGRGERKKGLHLDEYDYVSLVSTDNREIYTFRKGGSGGSSVGSVTIVYVDSTRSTISTVTRN